MSLVDYDVCSEESSSDEDSKLEPRVKHSLGTRTARPLHHISSTAPSALTDGEHMAAVSGKTIITCNSHANLYDKHSGSKQSTVFENATNEVAPCNVEGKDQEITMQLPLPKKNSSVVPLINASGKKGSIKITAPEMAPVSSDSDEEMDVRPHKQKVSMTVSKDKPRSGLFAKLPPPTNFGITSKEGGSTFLPYVFSKQKRETSTRSDAKVAAGNRVTTDSNSGSLSVAEIRRNSASARTKVISRQVAANSSAANEDSDDDEIPGGFFNFSEKSTENDNDKNKVPSMSFLSGHAFTASHDVDDAAPAVEPTYPEVESSSYVGQPHASQSEGNVKDELDMEAIRHLQGKRRKKEEVNFIDIRADDALEGNKELLLKSISEEKSMNRSSHSKKKSGMPSGIQKRKHQLSYLVFQAKQRELELKNTWAQNRASRQQTQAKYGF